MLLFAVSGKVRTPPRSGHDPGGSMQLRAWRAGGVILLLALAAMPATKAEAAATRRPSLADTTHPAPRSRKARTSRRARRGPRGVVYARNAIVVDTRTDSVLYAKNADTEAPVASLTKLMTALVFLEQKPDLRRTAEVTRAELN